ncbi:MAG: integrase family protein [Desulfuromonadales bacterium]|nr:integrase family protein [Desulfuromonadales bacterium]
MPKATLTKKKIDSIKYADEGQVIYWDSEMPGLGLVVGTKTKTFRLQLDVKDATKSKGYRTVKKTLGRYGVDITLEQARGMISGYVDAEGQAVLGERIKIKLGEPTANAGEGVTLKELTKSYFTETKRRDGKDRRESSAIAYQNLIERHYAGWLTLTLKEVNELTPDVVMEKFQQVATGGEMSARNSAVMLSAVLNYGLAKYPGTLKSNPLAILTSRHVNVMKKIEPRHECLQYEPAKQRNDFKVFREGMEKMTEVRRDLYMFTLFTGMRRMEATALQWDQVNLEHGEILVEDTKNREKLHIPLNRQALAIVKRRRETVDAASPWVFCSTKGTINKTGYSVMRADHLKRATGLDITIHGLRRTYITTGRKLKRYEDTDKLTNHVDNSMAGKHYDETGIEDLRETTQMIGDTIERRMLEEKAKVIQIHAAQAA